MNQASSSPNGRISAFQEIQLERLPINDKWIEGNYRMMITRRNEIPLKAMVNLKAEMQRSSNEEIFMK